MATRLPLLADLGDVSGKRVLVRTDFNVPLETAADGTRTITDDFRIRAALPTIEWLREHGARVILCSHLGRPKGKVNDALRLAPVGRHLAGLLKHPVTTVPTIVGPEARDAIASMHDGDVTLLENLRFDPREEANDPEFARNLASQADLYVNDAFGAAHRAHASTEGIAHVLPAYLGLLMQREIDALGQLLESPERPFAAIIGGAKVSDKIAVLQNLVAHVDVLLIGGGMANTFLLAQGMEVGASLVERDQLETANAIMTTAQERHITLAMPTDVVVASSIDASQGEVKAVDALEEDDAMFDIGPESARRYAGLVARQRTILWNGPLGVAENPAFAEGTKTVAQAVANADGFTVIGGGDSVAAVEQLGLSDHIDHISTGGGASLEFLEGKTLPGIAAIPDAKETA
jgi:phosphoglycerate kinase